MEKVLVILSGGQDSVTCLYNELHKGREVEAVTFWYNQNHGIELSCAEEVCEEEGVVHHVIDISFLNKVSDSALTTIGGDVNARNSKGLPASFVPNRNAVLITAAHALAQKIGAIALVTGVCQTDYSGYPDCRLDFIESIQKTLNLGSGADIKIETPLMSLTKAETFRMAQRIGKLKNVVEKSHTCYKGNHEDLHDWGYGCDNCPACELRKKGYEEFAAKYI